MTEIACFDVCGTLYRGQTTPDFCRFVQIQTYRSNEYILDIVLVMAKVLSKFRLRRLSHMVSTTAYIKPLRGLHRQDLDLMAQAFWTDRWVNQSIAPVIRSFEDYYQRGDHVLLLSAAIDPPIRVLAQNLGVDFLCSTLKYDDQDQVVGLDKDLFGKKEDALRSYLDAKTLQGKTVFFSDNLNDLPLLSQVNYGVFVSQSAKSTIWVRKKFRHVSIIEI